MQEEKAAQVAAAEPAPQAPPVRNDPDILARLLLALEARQEAREPAQPPAPVVVTVNPQVTQNVPVYGTQPQEKKPQVIAVEPAPQAPPVYNDSEILARLMVLEARQQALETAKTQPAAQPTAQPAAPVIQREERVPQVIVVEPSFKAPSAPPDPEVLSRLTALETRQETLEATVTQPQAPVAAAAPVIQSVPEVKPGIPEAKPGLPDPKSGKTYRLQVGTFSTLEAADRMSRLVGSIGFMVIQEQSGSMYRVLAVDIPAALVQPAVQRLGVIGIDQVWVRE